MMKPNVVVIFGASGDLTFRKLVPSLYDLFCQQMLPKNFAVLGVARSELSDDAFREKMRQGIKDFALKESKNTDKLDEFLRYLYYLAIDTSLESDYVKVKEKLEALDESNQTEGNYLFYLSTPPSLYEKIPRFLSAAGLSNSNSEQRFRRIIIEKPFGYDLQSARDLNVKLRDYFKEDQIYRIDHYLGKETVQNLLVLRFGNGIFEPLWNRNFIHHVEITASESIGVEDRGGYYDHSGALRDMVQNHLLQLAALTAIEPPSVIGATSIRNEVLKVFQSLRPIKEEEVEQFVIRGQYGSSHIRGEYKPGYREEKGVDPDSRTETYVAMKFFIDNWRWGGVPFYLRTGKRLPTRVTEIVIHFRETPHTLFNKDNGAVNPNNQLVIRIQPDEGILMKFGLKMPGGGFDVNTVNMDFHYSNLSDVYVPSAYERLLLDAMMGDATLYIRGDAVEAAWEFVQPILDAWKNRPEIPVYQYPAGTWGPEHADQLVGGPVHTWRYPCKNLADDGVYCEL
jgi:glucose-6-phosphate 1-dehydrogenase